MSEGPVLTADWSQRQHMLFNAHLLVCFLTCLSGPTHLGTALTGNIHVSKSLPEIPGRLPASDPSKHKRWQVSMLMCGCFWCETLDINTTNVSFDNDSVCSRWQPSLRFLEAAVTWFQERSYFRFLLLKLNLRFRYVFEFSYFQFLVNVINLDSISSS